MKTETPEPGIYEDVPFSDYLQWDAISNSKLSLMSKSARHYKLGFCKEPTPAMQLGQLYHCGVLEPLMFADRYAICPDFHLDAENCTATGAPSKSTTTKFVKNRMEEFAAMADGREVVPKDWYDDMLSLVRSLHSNEAANRIMNAEGPRELSIIWLEQDLLMKARIDKVAYGLAIADLKSTADITKFTRAIGNYGYHRQMAHYQRGWLELTGDMLTPWLIPVESSAPFTCQAAPLSEEALSAGYSERRRLIDQLQLCLDTDTWPGLPNPKQWNVPEWALDEGPIQLMSNGELIEV